MRNAFAMGLGLSLLTAVTRAEGQELTGPDVRDLFLQLDGNNDTVIERDEVPDRGRAAFEVLLKLGDADRDGKLQAAEMRDLTRRALAGDRSPEGLRKRFEAMDKDGDGKLSRDEFRGRAAMFDRVDTDHDGMLTRREFVQIGALVGQRQQREEGRSPQASGPGGPEAAAPKP